MSAWQLELALAAAERKLELLRRISCQMVTVIPSALLELYEINRIAVARGHSRRPELKYLAEEALQLSAKMGHSFVRTYHQKMTQTRCVSANDMFVRDSGESALKIP